MPYERDFGGIPHRARQIRTNDDGSTTWFIEYDQDRSGHFYRRATFTQRGDHFEFDGQTFRDIEAVMIRYWYGPPR
ncbi:hypothetical protein AB0O70_05535 [Microbacterium paraoxydans]|uniref:hypothetical protein n=1 Tax=Microbacterium paraoxydans TaxID=199592 RepID=UPI0034302970